MSSPPPPHRRAGLRDQRAAFEADPAWLRGELARRGRGAKSALAAALGLTVDKLSKSLSGVRAFTAAERLALAEWVAAQPSAARAQSDAVPVFGLLAADGRVSLSAGDEVDQLGPRTDGADWGVRVATDALEPRLFEGEVVLVKAHLPPARGRDCVVELRDLTALVGLYDGRRDGVVYVRLLHPPQVAAFPASNVAGVHAVIARL